MLTVNPNNQNNFSQIGSIDPGRYYGVQAYQQSFSPSISAQTVNQNSAVSSGFGFADLEKFNFIDQIVYAVVRTITYLLPSLNGAISAPGMPSQGSGVTTECFDTGTNQEVAKPRSSSIGDFFSGLLDKGLSKLGNWLGGFLGGNKSESGTASNGASAVTGFLGSAVDKVGSWLGGLF